MDRAKRDDQLRRWVRAAIEPNNDGYGGDKLLYEDEVMWGVSFNLNDESRAPEALFCDEEKAKAYAELFDRQEWHVGPYVLRIEGRNDFEVPRPEDLARVALGGTVNPPTGGEVVKEFVNKVSVDSEPKT